MMYSSSVKNVMFAGARRHFEKYNYKKCERCFLLFAMRPRAEEEMEGERRRRRHTKEQEIKMCLAQLYFIRRAENFYFRCSLTLAARSFIN